MFSIHVLNNLAVKSGSMTVTTSLKKLQQTISLTHAQYPLHRCCSESVMWRNVLARIPTSGTKLVTYFEGHKFPA